MRLLNSRGGDYQIKLLEYDTYTSSFSQEVEVFLEIMPNIPGDQPSSERLTSYATLNAKDVNSMTLCKNNLYKQTIETILLYYSMLTMIK